MSPRRGKTQEQEQEPKAPIVKQRSKVVMLRVSVGNEDERDMQQFIAESKAALYEAGAKNVTSMGENYVIDGQVKSVAEVEQPEPEPEPEPETEPEAESKPQRKRVPVENFSRPPESDPKPEDADDAASE